MLRKKLTQINRVRVGNAMVTKSSHSNIRPALRQTFSASRQETSQEQH